FLQAADVIRDFHVTGVQTCALPIFERPSGTIEFDVATARPDGLAAIVNEFLGQEASQLVRYVAGSGNALKLSGKATGAGSAAGEIGRAAWRGGGREWE